QAMQAGIVALVDSPMIVRPARNTGEVGVRQGALLAQQPWALAQQRFQRLVSLVYAIAAIGTQGVALRAVFQVFKRIPQGAERTEETGVQVGQHLVQAVEVAAALAVA